MAKKIINIGSAPNSRDGDTVRTAFNKINQNFDELYQQVSAITGVADPDAISNLDIKGSVYADDGTLMIDAASGKILPSALPNNTPSSYTFNAIFDSQGNLSAVDGLPEGWTANVSDNFVTIIHPLMRLPNTISYWGHRDNGEFRLRFPTPGYPALVLPSMDYRIELQLTAATTGADENQFAVITIMI